MVSVDGQFLTRAWSRAGFLVALLFAAVISACGGDHINQVKDGYFPDDNRRSVGEVLSMCSYTRDGKWSNVPAGADGTPRVKYEVALRNRQLVNWVMPELNSREKKKIANALDSRGFRLMMKMSFVVFRNGSFDLEKIVITSNDREVTSPEITEQIRLQIAARKGLADIPVDPSLRTDFNWALYTSMATNSELAGKTRTGLLGMGYSLYDFSLFSVDTVRRSFHPLMLNKVRSVAINEEFKTMSIKATSVITDINDYRLNEVGESYFENGYGIFEGTGMMKSDDILQMIAPYTYRSLASVSLEAACDFNALDLGEACTFKDVDVSRIVLGSAGSDRIYLSFDNEMNPVVNLDPVSVNSDELTEFLAQQQSVINYTTMAYPLAYAAQSITAMTREMNDFTFFRTLVAIRDRVMNEAGAEIPVPLRRATSI